MPSGSAAGAGAAGARWHREEAAWREETERGGKESEPPSGSQGAVAPIYVLAKWELGLEGERATAAECAR